MSLTIVDLNFGIIEFCQATSEENLAPRYDGTRCEIPRTGLAQ